jgi:hypothetical protein
MPEQDPRIESEELAGVLADYGGVRARTYCSLMQPFALSMSGRLPQSGQPTPAWEQRQWTSLTG